LSGINNAGPTVAGSLRVLGAFQAAFAFNGLCTEHDEIHDRLLLLGLVRGKRVLGCDRAVKARSASAHRQSVGQQQRSSSHSPRPTNFLGSVPGKKVRGDGFDGRTPHARDRHLGPNRYVRQAQCLISGLKGGRFCRSRQAKTRPRNFQKADYQVGIELNTGDHSVALSMVVQPRLVRPAHGFICPGRQSSP
jgi:hypothetical protein